MSQSTFVHKIGQYELYVFKLSSFMLLFLFEKLMGEEGMQE